MTILKLFYEFFVTGLFSIGGGYATLPFLYSMAERYDWFDRALISDMIAISESTPGPIGIKMAAYAGFTAAGFVGGIVASLAIMIPSVVIISLIAKMLTRVRDNRVAQSAFYGLRPCVAALIAWAGFAIATPAVVDLSLLPDFANALNATGLILFVVFLTAVRFIKKLRPVVLFAAAAVVGVILKL